FNYSFEGERVGFEPDDGNLYRENKSDAIVVTDSIPAASGKNCLMILDSPDMEHSYNPHFYYSPQHAGGTSRCSFDINISADTRMLSEWRGPGHPYDTGPGILIYDGKLTADGGVNVSLPAKQWIHIAIATELGPQSNGKWDMEVVLPGGNTNRFENLPYESEKFNRLDWLGFCSLATNKTVFYLDNLNLSTDH
ncbi:MAG: hypothetical protein WC693_07135, partial [Patescibacteria group bacterium]